ncbi:MAG: transposase [Patescibacteria group bacterium]
MARLIRPSFVNGHFYHVFNRGVDKRDVFLEDTDYWRFLFDVKEFNDVNSTINILRRLNKEALDPVDKDPLVEVICYCLMPNHFHLVLKQLKDGGISKFMQKIGIGYTNYFNQKNERSGVLFQGKFKAILVDKDNYLNYLIQYIHLNPLDLIEPGWKKEGLKNWRKAKAFLEVYRWADCKNYDKYDSLLKECNLGSFGKINDWLID